MTAATRELTVRRLLKADDHLIRLSRVLMAGLNVVASVPCLIRGRDDFGPAVKDFFVGIVLFS